MEIKIERVWNGELDGYMKHLDKLNAKYDFDEDGAFATVEITDLKQLFTLAKGINQYLLINEFRENTIQIYDDYIE